MSKSVLATMGSALRV